MYEFLIVMGLVAASLLVWFLFGRISKRSEEIPQDDLDREQAEFLRNRDD